MGFESKNHILYVLLLMNVVPFNFDMWSIPNDKKSAWLSFITQIVCHQFYQKLAVNNLEFPVGRLLGILTSL